MELKWVFYEDKDIYIVPSIFPQITYYLQRENSNFTLEKVGGHHL